MTERTHKVFSEDQLRLANEVAIKRNKLRPAHCNIERMRLYHQIEKNNADGGSLVYPVFRHMILPGDEYVRCEVILGFGGETGTLDVPVATFNHLAKLPNGGYKG